METDERKERTTSYTVARPASFTHEPGRGYSRGGPLRITGEKKTKRTDEQQHEEDEEGWRRGREQEASTHD